MTRINGRLLSQLISNERTDGSGDGTEVGFASAELLLLLLLPLTTAASATASASATALARLITTGRPLLNWTVPDMDADAGILGTCR